MQIRNYALPLSMIAGVALYYIADATVSSAVMRHTIIEGIGVVQPMLIFVMLFITFCKIDFGELRLHGWHVAGLAFQCGLFGALAVLSQVLSDEWRVVVEGAMVCLVCPTATAAAVVTQKLGGNAGCLTAYTVLVNLMTAVVVSLVVPMLHPREGVSFVTDFGLIISRVMPLLFMPIVAALVVRRWWRAVPRWLRRYPDLAFYVWCFALMLAIAVTVRSIASSNYPLTTQIALGAASLVTCVLQFAFGRMIGGITGGQSLGQKNTVFAIWMGYTFFTPVTSIAGGLYSVWHNVYNAWQLAHTSPPRP